MDRFNFEISWNNRITQEITPYRQILRGYFEYFQTY